jgi:hypothetical protein
MEQAHLRGRWQLPVCREFRASEFLGSLPMSSSQAYVPLSSSAISPPGTAAQWFDLSSLGCIRLVG